MKFESRDYQIKAEEDARQSILEGHRKIILNLSTGSGKTVIAAMISEKAYAKKKKVLFLVNRRELVFQAFDKFTNNDLDCGIVMAGVDPKLDAVIQIASMQTYVRRMDLDELWYNKWWHDADIIFCDECHGSLSPSFQKILKAYGDKPIVIGLSATPCRSDGRGLGEYYTKIIKSISMSEMIDRKYLVPFRYFAPFLPDLSNPKIVAGDYSVGYLGQKMNQKDLIGDIYQNWSVIAPDRPTIIFAVNIAHSIAIEQEFLANGVKAKHLDHKTPKEERAQAIADMSTGSLQVLVNHGILCEGTDIPVVSCVVLARPTRHEGRYIQMGGRGGRPAPGKFDSIIIDHAGCINEHGFLESDREWSLDGKKLAWTKNVQNKKEKRTMKCPVCHAIMDGLLVCPDCGSTLKKFGRKIEIKEGELNEVKKGKKVAPSDVDKQRFYGMAVYYCREKGYSAGWSAHKYKEKFKEWPKNKGAIPIKPDLSFMNYLKHLNIKRSKSKQ